jgi:hypothetical protein
MPSIGTASRYVEYMYIMKPPTSAARRAWPRGELAPRRLPTPRGLPGGHDERDRTAKYESFRMP